MSKKIKIVLFFFLFLIATTFLLLIKAKKEPGKAFEHQGAEQFVCGNCNVIFISVTNLRADHLGTYGYFRDTSPNIDSFAKKCIVFENAFSHASWTLPVAISLFVSQYPFTHGLMNRKNYEPLPSDVVTFVDVLKGQGYSTAAFVGDRDYGQKFGHTSRFDEVYDYVNEQRLKDWNRYGVFGKTVPKAISWIKKNRSKKFFVFIQGYDSHCPFAIPEENDMFDPDYDGEIDFTKSYWTFRRTRPIKVKSESGQYMNVYLLKTKPDKGSEYEEMFYPEDAHHMVALYDGEIYNCDRFVGKILREIENLHLDKKTIVVIFSEHGDMFGKYGRFMRGGPLRGTFYDDVLHIPLIIYHPNLRAKSISGLVQVIDIAPTLLDFLGIEKPTSFRGRSLKPLIMENTPVDEHVFAGSAYTPEKANIFFRHSSIILSVRSKDWKLIFEKLFYEDRTVNYHELFDLRNDPEELQNVAQDNPKVLKDLNDALYDWLRDIKADDIILELEK